MKFFCDNENKLVYGVGKFENGELEVDDPEDIEYMKENYDYEIENTLKVDESYTVMELREIGKQASINNYNKLRKKELIQAINSAELKRDKIDLGDKQ